jgi:hypothetical protein
MPPMLRTLCVALAVLVVAHACLAPVVEEGALFLLPVVIDASLIWLLWAFSRRRAGTLSWLSTYCIVAVIISILFSPFSSEYGRWSLVVESQFIAEAVVCVALFFALRMQSTKSWFHAAAET